MTAITRTESTVADYITLMKPGVMSLVVFTGFVGMVLAPGHLHPLQQFLTLLCIALGSGAGGAINMWYDRDIDAIMLRTASRPIPAGRIAPDDALAFGIFLGTGAVMLMGLALNWMAGGLLALAIGFYIVIYTMGLKRRTPQNIVIGGAAGAFPPMIGWAAATGDVSLQSLILFAIIFMWTPPHFWALALYRNADYQRANIPMMPVTYGPARTKLEMLIYTWILVGTTLLLPLLNMSGWLYTIGSSVLGIIFLYHIYRVQKDTSDRWAKKTFGYSILYLFMLCIVLVMDHWLLHHGQ